MAPGFASVWPRVRDTEQDHSQSAAGVARVHSWAQIAAVDAVASEANLIRASDDLPPPSPAPHFGFLKTSKLRVRKFCLSSSGGSIPWCPFPSPSTTD